jgi:hypothetical protein
MLARKARRAAAEANAEAAQIARQEKLEAYWRDRFAKAQDGHEITQAHIDYRNHGLFEWLQDFDYRTTKELRDQSKYVRRAIYLVGFVILLHHWLPAAWDFGRLVRGLVEGPSG